MSLNIPNVPWMGDAAQKGVESGTNIFAHLIGQAPAMANMSLIPSTMKLHGAQAEQAMADAFEKNMFAQLLARANGNQGMNYPGMQNQGQMPGMQQGQMPESQYQHVPDQGVKLPTKPGEMMDIGNVYGQMERPQQQAPVLPKNMMPPQQEGAQRVIFAGDPNMYGFDAIAGKHPKVPLPPATTVEGQLIQHWPSGKITATPVGLGPGELAAEKTMGEYQGKAYAAANDAAGSLGDMKTNFDRLAQTLEQFPNPDEVIGPMNKHLTQFFGNPEDQELLGEIMSTSGNIVLDAAKDIKGAFTGRDQTMVNSMKPNANDPYWVFLGKMKAMGELTDLAQKRASIYSELLHQKVPPHEALKMAQEQTDLSKVTDKYAKILRMSHHRTDMDQGKNPNFKDEAEAKEFLRTLGPDVQMRFYYKAKK